MSFYPPGIPDDQFIRGDVPMTKAEVRAVTMSKARLAPGLRVLDIGAGTGSLTVEAALLCPSGQVIAVERDPEAIGLLRENIARFALTNVTIITGEAPDALGDLPPCDRILLGGTGGRLPELLEQLPRYLVPGGWVVSNTICLESTNDILARLRQSPWADWQIVQVAVARGVPVGTRLVRFEAQSPVWVISARLEEGQ